MGISHEDSFWIDPCGYRQDASVVEPVNSNTLIAEHLGSCVVEVDVAGTVIWQITGLNRTVDVERLANGNTLIAEQYNGCVIEVDSSGMIVWQKTGLSWPADVSRLDGN